MAGRSEIKAYEILVLFRLVQTLRAVDKSIDYDHLVKLLDIIFMWYGLPCYIKFFLILTFSEKNLACVHWLFARLFKEIPK